MRVAMLTNNVMPPREGISRHVFEVAKRLPAHGIRPVILAKGEASWRRSTVDGVEVRHVPWSGMPPLHHPLARRTLERWLAGGADGADLLHVHLPLLPALDTKLPVIVTVHSPMLTDTAAISESGLMPLAIRANARLFSRNYEQAWLDRARTVVAVSEGVRAELTSHYQLHGREPLVLPNGVDQSFFASGPGRRPQNVVLYVGRLAFRKGLTRLLEAFAMLEASDLRLVLLGEGPLKPELEARARQLGIADRTAFLGFGPPEVVRGWLKRAKMFVNPADYESGPLTLLEAMAAGTPVVSTCTGLVAELGPQPPLLVTERQPEALASAIAEVLDHPDAAEGRADMAKLLTRTRFSWERVAVELARLYHGTERLAA